MTFFRLRPGFVLFLAAIACSDGSAPTEPRDTGPPLLEIRFPEAGVYDRDGDGLVDLEVAFTDTLSGVDLATLSVEANRPVHGPAGPGANLLAHWRVERADSLALVVEETVDNLLPRGRTFLTVAVADRSGNRASRQVPVDLPPAARHKVIDLQASLGFNTSQITLSPDGGRAYVTTEGFGGSFLSVVDLAALEWQKTVPSDIAALSTTVLDESRGRLYVVSIDEPRVAVFDLLSETFLAPILTSARGTGPRRSARSVTSSTSASRSSTSATPRPVRR